jgi:hypothetical protein
MNYIIDPKLIYWISVASSIKTLIMSIGIIALGVCVLVLIVYIASDYAYDDKEEVKTKLKSMFRATILSIFAIFISAFIPSKETSVEMIVASKVATESVQATKEEIYEIIDYTVEKIYGNNKDK